MGGGGVDKGKSKKFKSKLKLKSKKLKLQIINSNELILEDFSARSSKLKEFLHFDLMRVRYDYFKITLTLTIFSV